MTKPRTRSMLSFSGRSRRSSTGSIPKVDLHETAAEKQKYIIKTKADPSKAMNEAQPSVLAQADNTIGTSIRAIEHRDALGKIIADPDRSNPTRPRLERPLDTIRSFEAAVDGSYNRRASSIRSDSVNPSDLASRRNSSFNGFQPHQRPPADGGGYYGNRGNYPRPESYADNFSPPPNPHYNGRRFGPRNSSDPALYGNNQSTPLNQGVYPSHSHQQSYDTVGTATASNGSQWANSTDPSSENSSIDRVQPGPKPDVGESYGFNGFSQFQGPILEEHGQGSPTYGQPGYGQAQMANGNGNGNPYQGNGGPPPVPAHGVAAQPSNESRPKVPIRLGGNPGDPVRPRDPPAADHDKRKSWLKRRFSKG